jgi:GNAT superfamily N-acetyltransferase
MDGLSIKMSEDIVTSELRETAISSLNRHTARSNGVLFEDKSFSVMALMDEKLVGGLIGKVFWNWLYADLVWVEEEFRGRGIGAEVMKAAEKRAVEMNLTGIHLWTESWQAPTFYKKLGFSQFAEFKDFPPGHSRFGFRKHLKK